MNRPGVVTVLVLLSVALTGCAASSPATESSAVAGATSTPAAAPSTPAASTGATAAAADVTPVDPVLFVSTWADAGVDFDSPDGFHCGILNWDHVSADNTTLSPSEPSTALWGCAVSPNSWTVPSSSPTDFCYDAQTPCGNGIEVEGLGAPHFRYRGDMAFAGEDPANATNGPGGGSTVHTLGYGSSVSYGDVTCSSALAGVTCENSASGHGFTVAALDYRTW